MLTRIAVLLLLALLAVNSAHADDAKRPNILFITVDDMNWDSIGVYGSKVDDITPNIDRLAREGMQFDRAHLNISICMPCRATWMTGRYPHNSGALGFDRINPGVPTMPETLRQAGYFTGLMAKNAHVIPSRHATAFDVNIQAGELGIGREPSLYYQHAKAFLQQAKAAGKPFFLMANSQDPHRPFAGSAQEKQREGQGRGKAKKKKKADDEHEAGDGKFPGVRRTYKPEEVTVPRFLPELPDVRQGMAEYFTSVHRADEIVGAVLRALDEEGLRESTVVFFSTDNGMALPFAKTNTYHHSTKTPLIVRWPGVTRSGSREGRHMVAAIDIAPTMLDIVGLPNLDGADGRSFKPVLEGKPQDDRDLIFAHINTISSGRSYAMRKVQDRQYGYIYNAWSEGKTVFKNESQNGLTMKAMQRAAEQDQSIAARVRLFLYRVPEELYDAEKDPDALHNLIDHPDHQDEVRKYRQVMLRQMEATKDPETEGFRKFLAEK